MTFKGHVHNGAIVLDETLNVPEGTSVMISALPEGEELHPDVLKYGGCLQYPEGDEAEYYEYFERKYS